MAEDKTQDAAKPAGAGNDFAQGGKPEGARAPKPVLDQAEGEAMRQARQDSKLHTPTDTAPKKS